MNMISRLCAIEGISLALVIVGCIILALMLAFGCMKMFSEWTIFLNRRRSSEMGVDVDEFARAILDKEGLTDITIKLGWFYRYNKKKKLIVLNKGACKRNYITGYAMATELVTRASLIAKGEKKVPKYALCDGLGVGAAISFLLFIVVLLAANIAENAGFFLFSFVILLVAGLLFLASFILSLRNIKAQKHVYKVSLEYLTELNVFDEDDFKRIKKIYKAYLIQRMIQSALTFFYLIKVTLLLTKNIIKIFGRNK